METEEVIIKVSLRKGNQMEEWLADRLELFGQAKKSIIMAALCSYFSTLFGENFTPIFDGDYRNVRDDHEVSRIPAKTTRAVKKKTILDDVNNPNYEFYKQAQIKAEDAEKLEEGKFMLFNLSSTQFEDFCKDYKEGYLDVISAYNVATINNI